MPPHHDAASLPRWHARTTSACSTLTIRAKRAHNPQPTGSRGRRRAEPARVMRGLDMLRERPRPVQAARAPDHHRHRAPRGGAAEPRHARQGARTQLDSTVQAPEG